jgi:PLP dependent protein
MTLCYQREMTTDPLIINLKDVESRIRSACARAQRNPDEIRILLATKTVSPERLKIAFKQGYTLFGENTAQELVKKYAAFERENIDWHFIGRLQTNKVKDVVNRCHCIHSLDRISLAKEIQKRASQPVHVLIEIHASQEQSKAGIAPENIEDFLAELRNMDKLIVSGVMTIADNSNDSQLVRNAFRTTKAVFEKVKQLSPQPERVQFLSMGMSSDFEIAIEEGANLIRLGSIIFGKRI